MYPEGTRLPYQSEEESGGDKRPTSVFASVDQTTIIAKLDANDDDDLGSNFFADSMQDVENAAANVFDIGIRTLSIDPREDSAATAFGAVGQPAAPAAPRSAAPTSAAADQAKQAAELKAKQAFVLGGPQAAARARLGEDPESPDRAPGRHETR